MIHHQNRRDLSAAESETADTEVRDAVAPVVPPQVRRPTRDAYDLYAQIYAIRTEDHTS